MFVCVFRTRRCGCCGLSKARGRDGEEDLATVAKMETKVLALVFDHKVDELDGRLARLEPESEDGDVVERHLEDSVVGVEDGEDKGLVPDRIKRREMFLCETFVSFELQADLGTCYPPVWALDLLALEQRDRDAEGRGRVVALYLSHPLPLSLGCVAVFATAVWKAQKDKSQTRRATRLSVPRKSKNALI